MNVTLPTHQQLSDILGDHLTDWAQEYGEPGYSSYGPILFGDWWCQCDRFGQDDHGRNNMHRITEHHPRYWQALEDQHGVTLEWLDEWYVDHETGRAWRTTADSYSWQPSIVFDGECDYLTPDHDADVWIDWAMDSPAERCIPRVVNIDPADHGFTLHTDRLENGFHYGQDDDPRTIVEQIRAGNESADILFTLDATGQFDIRFSVWTRADDDDELIGE